MAQIIYYLFLLFYILILTRVILSWVRVSPYDPTWGPVVRFVHQATEPFLAPVRRMLPPMGGLDLSPLIVLFIANILQSLLVRLF